MSCVRARNPKIFQGRALVEDGIAHGFLAPVTSNMRQHPNIGFDYPVGISRHRGNRPFVPAAPMADNLGEVF